MAKTGTWQQKAEGTRKETEKEKRTGHRIKWKGKRTMRQEKKRCKRKRKEVSLVGPKVTLKREVSLLGSQITLSRNNHRVPLANDALCKNKPSTKWPTKFKNMNQECIPTSNKGIATSSKEHCWWLGHYYQQLEATSNKGIPTSGKDTASGYCISTSSQKLLVTRASLLVARTLLVARALLLVARSYQ